MHEHLSVLDLNELSRPPISSNESFTAYSKGCKTATTCIIIGCFIEACSKCCLALWRCLVPLQVAYFRVCRLQFILNPVI